MIRKILVYENVLAAQHPAIERATQLAQHGQLELKIVDVVEGTTRSRRQLPAAIRQTLEEERISRLESLCKAFSMQGVTVTSELLSGRPFVEIARAVVHEGFHLVIKTAAGLTSTELQGNIGPVDLRLVRNCPCPVWLEVPLPHTGSPRILVAIDPQADDQAINEVLLEVASSLSRALRGSLCLVAAWQVPDEQLLQMKLGAEESAKYTRELQLLAQKHLQSAIDRLGQTLPLDAVSFAKGDPTDVILAACSRFQPEIVVVGAVGQPGIRGLLIGDTADTLLRHIDRSVLLVRRGGLFRS